MEFFENGDFTNYDDEEEVDVCVCHECGNTFEVNEGDEPKACPGCGIEFLPEGTC